MFTLVCYSMIMYLKEIILFVIVKENKAKQKTQYA